MTDDRILYGEPKPNDGLIEDALAFGALVGGEFDRWITWAVATIRDRNERIAELERERALTPKSTHEAKARIAELRADFDKITGFIAGAGVNTTEIQALVLINGVESVQKAWARAFGEEDEDE